MCGVGGGRAENVAQVNSTRVIFNNVNLAKTTPETSPLPQSAVSSPLLFPSGQHLQSQHSSALGPPCPGLVSKPRNTQETVHWPHGALSLQPPSPRRPFHNPSLNMTPWSSGGQTSLHSSITKEQTSQHDS